MKISILLEYGYLFLIYGIQLIIRIIRGNNNIDIFNKIKDV
jgi:hypothetical protein